MTNSITSNRPSIPLSIEPSITEDTSFIPLSRVFLASPQTHIPRDNVAVGYIGSSHSACHETIEETLHLAQLLKCNVFGINANYQPCSSYRSTNSSVIFSIISIWQQFFSECPTGCFIQYFYGNGVYTIERAITLFSPLPNLQTIVFIGVNPTKNPLFPSFLIHSLPCSHRLSISNKSITSPITTNACSIFFKRFNDPIFSSALVRYFLETTNSSSLNTSEIESSNIQTEITHTLRLAPPPRLFCQDSSSHTLTRKNDHELFGEALQIIESCDTVSCDFWPKARIDNAVDLALNSLRIYSYISLLPLIRVQNQTLSNSLATNGTLQKNISYPPCIYPCGITPNGTFTTSTFSINNIFVLLTNFSAIFNNSIQILKRYQNQLPYNEYLFQESSSDLVVVGRQLGLYPCDINSQGLFTNLNTYPYGGPYWDHTFPYAKFFSGELIDENRFKSNKNNDLVQFKQKLPTNWEFPQNLYPWGITPNGTFGNCKNFSQPYGAFNNNFPYISFFNGSFDYEKRFQENLATTYLNQIGITLSDSLQDVPYAPLSTYILVHYWTINSIARLILISCKNKGHLIRKVKAIALGIASSAFITSIVDICYNARKLSLESHQDKKLGHSLLVTYDGIYLTREIITFVSPWARETIHQLSAEVGKVKDIKRNNTLLCVSQDYLKDLQNTRIISGLFGLIITGLLAIGISSKYHFSSRSQSSAIECFIFSVFTGALVCLLLLFLYISNRRR